MSTLQQQLRIFLLTLALSAVCPAVAQLPKATALWQDSTAVTLSFPVSVADAALGSDYACIVTPRVLTAGDSVDLQPLVFRGHRNAKYVSRLRYFGDAPGAASREHTLADTVAYTATLRTADHPWLLSAPFALTTCREAEGCCAVTPLDTLRMGTFCYLPPVDLRLSLVEDNTGKAGELRKDNPVLHHISEYRPYDDTRVLRKEKGMLYVNFPLDKVTLLHDFRNNAGTLDNIVRITREIMADTTSSVRRIQIIGLASVEGSIAHNNWLAENRALSLKKYVQRYVPTPDSLYEICSGGEGWNELRDQISDSDFEGRDALLRIIDETADANERERRMKQYDGGRPWKYVKEHILQDQRNSGYVQIYYDYVPDNAARDINAASSLLRADDVAAALVKLEAVKSDPRSWNTYGVALCRSGREAEGIEYIRRAAEAGHPDARANLEQYEALERARRAYEAFSRSQE